MAEKKKTWVQLYTTGSGKGQGHRGGSSYYIEIEV